MKNQRNQEIANSNLLASTASAVEIFLLYGYIKLTTALYNAGYCISNQATEYIFDTSMISDISILGIMEAKAFASIVFPDHGGHSMSILVGIKYILCKFSYLSQ